MKKKKVIKDPYSHEMVETCADLLRDVGHKMVDEGYNPSCLSEIFTDVVEVLDDELSERK